MPDSHQWGIDYHSRTGESHYLANSFPHGVMIAMHLAFAAKPLILSKRAVQKSLIGIFNKTATIIAQSLVSLLFTAIQLYHEPYCSPFLFNSVHDNLILIHANLRILIKFRNTDKKTESLHNRSDSVVMFVSDGPGIYIMPMPPPIPGAAMGAA